MAKIKAFKCVRPNTDVASRVAALPYDVYNSEEAKVVVSKEPLSFLKIDRAETAFEKTMDPHNPQVYEKAKELFDKACETGTFIQDDKECLFLYELTMDGRSQTGIVSCSSVDDYLNNVIKKHENTRADKEQDRINHVDSLSAQTGPIFLAYRAKEEINKIVSEVKKENALYDFISEDGIGHRVWKISDEAVIAKIIDIFAGINEIYIADGHHRAASAVKVSLKRREENPNFTGDEEFNYFLSVMFPDSELKILDYNRVVKDLNGLSKEEFFEKVRAAGFEVKEVSGPLAPDKKGQFGMFLEGKWYELVAKECILSNDAVEGLDVSILQNNLLGPVLGIKDPRTDKRIDFVGGIRGLGELEKRCEIDMKLAFSMYPTSMAELFSVADDGKLMPPKSTWFEPKLRSGIFIHKI
ncbi:MAG: DUF1015 domain-containing protein [Parasporobacterium sp.]|nr:DUF1015 domain-containing protein [Parasporobacterium sp.]